MDGLENNCGDTNVKRWEWSTSNSTRSVRFFQARRVNLLIYLLSLECLNEWKIFSSSGILMAYPTSGKSRPMVEHDEWQSM